MRMACAALLAMLVLRQTGRAADVLLKENFAQPQRHEVLGPPVVQIQDGQCHFASVGEETTLFTPLDDLSEAAVSTSVAIAKRLGGSWTMAGVYLHSDPDNHWRLTLVEAPDGRRYMELIETYCGVHQAQNAAPATGTRLTSKFDGNLQEWNYGKRYELRLTLTSESVTGEVRDPASGEFWRKTFYFTSGKAVKRGRPAIGSNGFQCAFGPMNVEGKLPPMLPGFSTAKGKSGSVVLLPGQQDDLETGLKTAFEKAGFGVTMLSWDDLGKGRIPAEAVDLLVVADARRLPAAAKPLVISFLRSRGKILFIGAPAFGELVAKTPKGWVNQEGYGEAFADSLTASPLTFADESWERGARYPDKHEAKIEPCPAEGEGAWKATIDLESWDLFGKRMKQPCPEGHSILTFWAKGDDNTTQLAVECVEEDGARWIGGAPLTTGWKRYVLRPSDFPHWPDSKAKRGGAGDRLNLQNLASIKFGFSGSHTPKVKEGAHTFWIRGIGSALDPGGEEPDFAPPHIEGLCPSFKLYPLRDTASLAPAQEQGILPADWRPAWRGKGYAPACRPAGRGFDRNAAWRWTPIAVARDAEGRERGTIIWMMLGNGVHMDAMWAGVGVADPADAAKPELLSNIVHVAKSMTRGCLLAEAGSRFFSYRDGEAVDLGAEVVNAGRERRRLKVRLDIRNSENETICEKDAEIDLEPGRRERVAWTWNPGKLDEKGYTVRTMLLDNDVPIDLISHPLDRIADTPAGTDEYVTVRGSDFYLGDKKWFMLGVNYRPSMMAGLPTLDLYQRGYYDPVAIEQDLAVIQSLGMNFISATHALVPPKPEDPNSYRDMVDFLDRCQRRGIKVFYFLPWGRPFKGMDVEKIKQHIAVAGIKDHPAILAWELAWEPIENPWKGGMDFLMDEWNAWVVERYGSVENAERDWAFKPERKEGKLTIPTVDMCRTHGEWDRCAAAFRRFFSDCIGQAYGRTIRELRKFDPKHLITFRGGACGIPSGIRFAHHHSVGVAKHVDFLNPEGYSLMTQGWANPTPPDDIRKGGLVTLYYRWVSREKPVTWMEFGFTVRGFHTDWKTEMVHVDPEELARQKRELECFYRMFIESGARGAAPWWFPGGFRLGERSDFGIVNEDLTERPVCEIIRTYQPQFASVRHEQPTMYIDVDFDKQYADAWEIYGEQYLAAVQKGERPYLRTTGTGTDSANTPLIAVGDTPCNGHNPPNYLNAEFNATEINAGDGWREIRQGDVIQVKAGAKVLCRASVGNTGEAKWLAPRADLKEGGVYLAGRKEYGLEFKAPIASDTDYLKDAEVKEFVLIPDAKGNQTVSFEMLAEGRTHFGQRVTVRIRTAE
ncbi:MAG: hypothetical protein AB1696_06715 [Planctomycetota bacterium]